MNGLSRPVGSALAITGGVVALVGNLLSPRFDQDDNVEVYRAAAESDRLVPSGLILIVALLLTTVGIVAIAASLRDTAGHDAAWLGSAAAAVGGAVAFADLGIQVFAYPQLARRFADADGANQIGAFWATDAVDKVNSGLFSMWTILLLGLAPVLISAAMLQSRAFPAWVAGIGAVGGLICLVVGAVNLTRENQSTLNLVFLVGSLLVTAWLLAAGALLRRLPETVASG